MPKAIVDLTTVRKLMIGTCAQAGLTADESKIVTDNYLDAEILGKETHGIRKFVFESQFFNDRLGTPEITLDTGPVVKVGGNKEVGPIAAQYAIRVASERARQYGVAFVGMDNIQRYGMLRTWALEFDHRGLFGLVMNTCEPAMAGYKGNKKVLGTNPMSFAIPTTDKTYVVDMASSEVAMSLIWKCLAEGSPLPPDTFYDSDGAITQDPQKAKAVKNFGGVKGYALALLIQIMCGPLFGFKSGPGITDKYDIGYLFIAVDPDKTTTHSQYKSANTDLVEELLRSGAIIPGARSLKRTTPHKITIDEELLIKLQTLGGKKYATS